MQVKPPFVLREQPTASIRELLNSVTLGTNGARYRHLNTESRIEQLYQPLYFSLERNDKAIGNITFCRREVGWYVRFFAFDALVQSSGTVKPSKRSSSKLKQHVEAFFSEALENVHPPLEGTHLLYAYIDPRNERSIWMSQNFGFQPVAKIATQTFSRVKPKKKKQVRMLTGQEIKTAHQIVNDAYCNHQLKFTYHTFNDAPIYGLFSEQEELLAFSKVYTASWVIERMPGKNGGMLTSIIPFVPRLRKIIQPSKHDFSVFEAVWMKHENPDLLETLFEGMLFLENTTTSIWWVDEKDKLYKNLMEQVNWGLLHKINGVSHVDLVVRSNNLEEHLDGNVPFYTTGIDFV